MAKLKGTAEIKLKGSCEPNMAERTSLPTREEHKSDLTVEKGAPVSHKEFHFQPPYPSKISRPRSPSSNARSEDMSKRPAININGNSYQFNNSYVINPETNGSTFPTLHQIPRASNSHVRPQTLQIMEKPSTYLPNGPNQFNNPYQYNQFPAPTQISNHNNNYNILSYNWENSMPLRPSFDWSKFDSFSQSESESQILYDPLVHNVEPPPVIPPDNNKKSDSESMKISPQVSEQEEEAQSNNISLPPLTKNNNNNNSNNNIVNNNDKMFYYGSLGAEESNEVSSSNSLSFKPGQTGQFKFNKRESKELKQFKIALAEYIKELLKPAWQKGILSKETHKRVVKKSVEKVAGSVKSNQVPDCEESTEQYLSLYKPKIEKLLQEYLEIYRKSEQRDLEMEINSVV